MRHGPRAQQMSRHKTEHYAFINSWQIGMPACYQAKGTVPKEQPTKLYIYFFSFVCISIVKDCLPLAFDGNGALPTPDRPFFPSSAGYPPCAKKKVLPVCTAKRMANTFFISLMPHSTNYYNFCVADKNHARTHRKTITLLSRLAEMTMFCCIRAGSEIGHVYLLP